MSTNLDLMNIHLRVLFTINAGSQLLSVNEPDGIKASAPRFFLGRTRVGNAWAVRADLPERLAQELHTLGADEPLLGTDYCAPPRHADAYEQLLVQHSQKSVSAGPAYHFPKIVGSTHDCVVLTEKDSKKLEGGFEKLISELPNWQPFVALLEKGRAVSVCRSVRITPEGHEAGVETLPHFRRRGHAQEVVAEWARLVRICGALPLYSTTWENNASQALANKLGLECFGADYEIV